MVAAGNLGHDVSGRGKIVAGSGVIIARPDFFDYLCAK